MFNVTVVLILTTTQLQSDVDRLVHLSTTFRRRRIYFFKVRLQIFSTTRPGRSVILADGTSVDYWPVTAK